MSTVRSCPTAFFIISILILVFTFICFVFFPFIFSVFFSFFLVCRMGVQVYAVLYASLFSFLAILVSSILQLLIFFLFSPLLGQREILNLFFDSFIYSATIEEMIKFFLFYYFLLRVKYSSSLTISNEEKNKNQILILVMFFASCFAGFENISYMLFEIRLLPIRLVTASLLHILVSPYYLKAIIKTKNIHTSVLIIPIILHGTYNLLVTLGGVFFLLSFVIIFFLLIQNILVFTRVEQ